MPKSNVTTTVSVACFPKEGGPGSYDNPRRLQVSASATHNPHLVITSTFTRGDIPTDLYTITHVPTGLGIVEGLSQEQAHAVAGALGGLPIDWAAVNHTTDWSEAGRDVPPELRAWLIAVRDMGRRQFERYVRVRFGAR